MIINLCGYATSGKDAFADALVKNHGYVKIGWADRLYKMALALNPSIYYRPKWSPIGWRWPLSSFVEKRGWTEAKKIPAIRRYLQFIGTEVVRDCLGEDAWVNAAMPDIKEAMRNGKNVVIANTRFMNEALAASSMGGFLVRIERPGVGPVNGHKSDSGEVFDLAQLSVQNSGTLEELETYADLVHESMSNAGSDVPSHGITSVIAAKYMSSLEDRAIREAIILALRLAAPEYADVSEYSKRHHVQINAVTKEEQATEYVVTVDGSEVGVIACEDGVLDLAVYLTR